MATRQRPPSISRAALLAETTSYERWNAKNENQRNPDFRRTHLIQLNAVAGPNKRLKIDKISSFVETVHTRPEAQQTNRTTVWWDTYHLVTAEPPFIHKTIDCMHHSEQRSKKGLVASSRLLRARSTLVTCDVGRCVFLNSSSLW